MNNVHDVVRLAAELFGDAHLGLRSLDADVGADEGARFAFLLVARSSFVERGSARRRFSLN